MQQEIEQKAKELYPDNMGGLDQSSVERYRAGYILGRKHGSAQCAGSAVWVKACGFKHKADIGYCGRAYSNKEFIYCTVRWDKKGQRFINGSFEASVEFEILVEPNEQPVEQKEPKNEFVDIVDNCLKEGKIVLDELKKHNALREQKEIEAVEFAEWLYENRWFRFENGRWEYTFEQGSSVSRGEYLKNYIKSTAQLYNEYQKQKKQ